jgi:hypothetical protein
LVKTHGKTDKVVILGLSLLSRFGKFRQPEAPHLALAFPDRMGWDLAGSRHLQHTAAGDHRDSLVMERFLMVFHRQIQMADKRAGA